MHLKHRMRAFQGVFHANPDYALWYGWNEMQLDLTEIRAMAEELRRRMESAPGTGDDGAVVIESEERNPIARALLRFHGLQGWSILRMQLGVERHRNSLSINPDQSSGPVHSLRSIDQRAVFRQSWSGSDASRHLLRLTEYLH